MKRYLKFIFILVITISVSCKKENNCPKEFELKGKITPLKDTFNLGDTLFLESSFNKILVENYTNKSYDMSNINWYPALNVYKIDSGDIEAIFNQKTDNFIDILYCSNNDTNWFTYDEGRKYLQLNYDFNEDDYKLEVIISIKKSGLFLIEFGGGFENSKQEFNGKCTNVDFNAYTRINNTSNNNIELLKLSQTNYFNDWLYNNEERFYKRGSFVLLVTDK